ncbi:MAG TPA: PRC-barrel domain-containing protein [Methanofastidiosum sp.]|jgi:sporulation protein YlmC with PRC-barrel domain|nr:PRC-barrel domain-containing protein [Methanofastidiosum sp.]HOC78110.1 PRC-barrel domain-containing protein [Methanofastidiosum sp.]HOG73692.1 PRC-barrel domain-containing protein [Methanofastidiosum sp.]HPA49678.1 PRC-barrel domain-containing protein [Methanofastidiosum sp.]HQK62827.1 PRC-barrel domain-containing protein [Methanofastidiosum sp.]
MRISKLYGLELYNTKGEYIGIVNDIILEVKDGIVFGLAVGQEKGIENTAVSFKDVSAIGDIVIVRAKKEESVKLGM